MDVAIDTELLITLVENKPVLWDKTIENYKNKQLNFMAWKEICMALKEDFEILSDKEKNEFGKLVVKQWSNARDNWMRCCRKLKECKSGSRAKSIPKYKFYEQMQFLNKIVCSRPTAKNMPTAEGFEESHTAPKEDSAVPKKKRRKTSTEQDELSKKIASLVDSVEKEDNSRIMSFFRGIAPPIERFNDADIVEFQYEVVRTMRNISQRRQVQSPQIYHQTPTPATYLSQPPLSQNRLDASGSSTSNEIGSAQSPGYVAFTGGSSNTEGSVDSLHDAADSQTEESAFQFDFANSPDFYEL